MATRPQSCVLVVDGSARNVRVCFTVLPRMGGGGGGLPHMHVAALATCRVAAQEGAGQSVGGATDGAWKLRARRSVSYSYPSRAPRLNRIFESARGRDSDQVQ